MIQQSRYESGQSHLTHNQLSALLKPWREELGWLKHAPFHPLQQSLKNLDLAYKRFFSKLAGFPNRKKKNQHDSVRFPDPKQIKVIEPRSKIQLPKLGLVKYINARPILGMVKNATLSRKADK